VGANLPSIEGLIEYGRLASITMMQAVNVFILVADNIYLGTDALNENQDVAMTEAMPDPLLSDKYNPDQHGLVAQSPVRCVS
jgi:hypothetical protein